MRVPCSSQPPGANWHLGKGPPSGDSPGVKLNPPFKWASTSGNTKAEKSWPGWPNTHQCTSSVSSIVGVQMDNSNSKSLSATFVVLYIFVPSPCCPQSLWPIYRSTYLPPVSHNPSSYPLPLLPSPVCHYGKVHGFCRVESHVRFQAAKGSHGQNIDICYSVKMTSTSASTVWLCFGIHPICQP
jgi:hypothetical protein